MSFLEHRLFFIMSGEFPVNWGYKQSSQTAMIFCVWFMENCHINFDIICSNHSLK